MQIKIDGNDLKIDLHELFSNMDQEQLEEIASAYGWHSLAYKDLIKSLKKDYAAENYNSDLYKLRKAFFLMPNESYSYISSKLIKEAAGMGANISCFVPKYIEKKLKEKLGK